MFGWLGRIASWCGWGTHGDGTNQEQFYEEQPYDEDAQLDGHDRVINRSCEEQGAEGLDCFDFKSASTLPSLPPPLCELGEAPEKLIDIEDTEEQHAKDIDLSIGCSLIPGPAHLIRLSPEPVISSEADQSANEEVGQSVQGELEHTETEMLKKTVQIGQSVDEQIPQASGVLETDPGKAATSSLEVEQEACVVVVPETDTGKAADTSVEPVEDADLELDVTQSGEEEDEEPLDPMVTKYTSIKTLFDNCRVGKGVLDKISFWQGDITKLEIDAIVNAANSGLRGGGGVDGAIHRAAGHRELQEECRKIGHCDTGDTVVTSACGLTHVKKILHTVGPQVFGALQREQRDQLVSCYSTSVKRALENNLRSLAFPCISTGIYGYPNDHAAYTVLKYFENFFADDVNSDKLDRVVFCLFMPVDVQFYKKEADKLARKLALGEEEAGDSSSRDSADSDADSSSIRRKRGSSSELAFSGGEGEGEPVSPKRKSEAKRVKTDLQDDQP